MDTCGPRMSAWRNEEVMIAEEVTVTEGHDPGRPARNAADVIRTGRGGQVTG